MARDWKSVDQADVIGRYTLRWRTDAQAKKHLPYVFTGARGQKVTLTNRSQVAAVPLADVQRFWNDLGPAKRDTFRTHWAQSGESVLDRAGDVAHDAGEIVHDIAKSKIVKGAAKVADAVFFGGEPALSKGLDSVDKSATSIAKKTAAKAVPKSAPRPAPKPLPKPAAAKSAPKPAAFTRKVSASSARSLLAKAQPGLSSAQLTHLVNTTVVLELAK